MQYSVDEFKYNELPKELSDFIIEKENILNGIKHRYAKEVGKVFYEAQQEFSDFNNGGLFEKWYTSIGFKKEMFITTFKFITKCNSCTATN